MAIKRYLMVLPAFVLFTISANAGSLVYVVNSNQFGTVDLSTGAFSQIGSDLADGVQGLVPGPNGSVITLAFNGNLERINTSTGAVSVIGASGLADCSQPTSPCGPTSVNTLGNLAGTIFAVDFANDLYTVNPVTGVATLIGLTGIPALPFIPLSPTGDADGSFNFYDENLFGAGGKLYANLDTGVFDPTTFKITQGIAPMLYQINPLTGHATLVAPVPFGLTSVVNVNGTVFAFDGATSQVVTLDVAIGITTRVSDLDPAVGIIDGATAAVPEPVTIALTGIGLALLIVSKRRRPVIGRIRLRHQQHYASA